MYEKLSKVGDIVAARRMILAGHCVRQLELVASELVLWAPQHEIRPKGRRKMKFVDVLRVDAGLQTKGELMSSMTDRNDWRSSATTWMWPT